MKNYKKTYNKITDFLFNSQVIAKNSNVVLNNNLGVLKTRLIRGDPRYYNYFIKKVDNENIKISLDKNFLVYDKIKLGDMFRTNFYDSVGNKPIKTEKVDHISKKLKAVNGLHILAYRTSTYFLKTKRFREIPNLLRFFHNELYRQKEGDLSKVPGITWKVAKIDSDNILLECLDTGGIYDRFINDEGTYYPPQVPGDYYPDGYSAYCFAHKYITEKKKEYLEASWMAVEFVIKNYDDYKPTRIVWPHKDFKNLPIIETYVILKDLLEKQKLDTLRKFISKMNENFYESTNVFALKCNWHYLRQVNNFKESKKRMDYCIKRIKEEQTENGLIKDNFYIYHNSRDLTYHLYTLGFLANLINLGYTKAENIFLNGANFSLNLTSSDGEVSYLGRGCNNIYQIAATVYTFETASRILSKKDNYKATQFAKAAELIFLNLAKWQTKEGYIPNSLNMYKNERLAWNHCETPYNAQSAYFLIKADKIKSIIKSKINIPLKIQNKIIDFSKSGYVGVGSKSYGLVFFGGTTKSFAWSGGKHFNGLPGMALLFSNKFGTITPILDEASGNIPLTDIPYYDIKELYKNGKINVIKNKFVTIKYSNNDVDKYYVCAENYLLQICKNKTDKRLKYRNIYSEEKLRWKLEDNKIKTKNISVVGVLGKFKIYRARIPNPRGYKNIILETEIEGKETKAILVSFTKDYNLKSIMDVIKKINI